MMNSKVQFQKIVIFGAGNVGTSFAALAIDHNLARQICLYDVRRSWLTGQIMDLQDRAIQNQHNCQVQAADFNTCHNADLIVLVTGAKPKPNQTRDDLANANALIITDVVQKIHQTAFAGFVIVVTNPVDQITYLVHKLTGWSRNRIIGTGTSIDASRLQLVLQNDYHINRNKITPTVLGEHGATLLFPLAMNHIHNQPNFFQHQPPSFWKNLHTKVVGWLKQIVMAKKATFFGISYTIYQIAWQLLNPVPKVMNLGVLLDECVVGHPCFIDQTGIKLAPLVLNAAEQQQWRKIIQIMQLKQHQLWQFVQQKNLSQKPLPS